jgi:hypothetical protein
MVGLNCVKCPGSGGIVRFGWDLLVSVSKYHLGSFILDLYVQKPAARNQADIEAHLKSKNESF